MRRLRRGQRRSWARFRAAEDNNVVQGVLNARETCQSPSSKIDAVCGSMHAPAAVKIHKYPSLSERRSHQLNVAIPTDK